MNTMGVNSSIFVIWVVQVISQSVYPMGVCGYESNGCFWFHRRLGKEDEAMPPAGQRWWRCFCPASGWPNLRGYGVYDGLLWSEQKFWGIYMKVTENLRFQHWWCECRLVSKKLEKMKGRENSVKRPWKLVIIHAFTLFISSGFLWSFRRVSGPFFLWCHVTPYAWGWFCTGDSTGWGEAKQHHPSLWITIKGRYREVFWQEQVSWAVQWG